MSEKYLVIEWTKNYDAWIHAEEERRSVYDALEYATQICADHDQQPHIEVFDDVENVDDVETALDDCDHCLSYRWIDRDRLKYVEAEDAEKLKSEGVKLLYGPDYTHYIAD